MNREKPWHGAERKVRRAAGKRFTSIPNSDLAMRPEVGTQPQFRKKKPPVTYRYNSSLSPSLEWDGRNPVREQGNGCWR